MEHLSVIKVFELVAQDALYGVKSLFFVGESVLYNVSEQNQSRLKQKMAAL